MDPPEVPKTLTKLSSICVLEYLSFERRQYISAQLSGFRKVEKSIPLHLNHLAISVGRIRINDNEYYLKRRGGNSKNTEFEKLAQWDLEQENDILPGDFCLGNPQNYIFNQNFPMENSPFPWTTQLRVTQFQGAYSRLDIPLGFLAPIYDCAPIHVAFKKLVFDLLGNRPMIFTKKLEFFKTTRDSKIYRLPLDLKIQAETLETVWFSFDYAELDRISRMLGPKPLKEFSTQYHNFEVFTHPIAQNAQKLTVCSGPLFDYRLINHRNIRLKKWGPGVGNSIQEWIGNENTVGMEFAGDIELMHLSDLEVIKEEKELKGTMYWKKCRYGGKRVRADERFPNTLYSLSFPRVAVPGTELQVSLLRNPSCEHPFQIHLKIQESETAIPELFDSMGLELKIWETRNKIKKGIRNGIRNGRFQLRQIPRRIRRRYFPLYNFLRYYSYIPRYGFGIHYSKKRIFFLVCELTLVLFVIGILGYFLVRWVSGFFLH